MTAGSSPLTRGRRFTRVADCSMPGLIPAHAGSTESFQSYPEPLTAHPRSRGVDAVAIPSVMVSLGSSPLTRGRRHRGGRRRHRRGLIPAHAGSTGAQGDYLVAWAAHPRSRGVDRAITYAVRAPRGSSPLTRGRPSDHVRRSSSSRLIPAHAGSTRSLSSPKPGSSAHPRSRGVDRLRKVGLLPASGSSPLTRGRLPRPVHRRCRAGLIPAHAGSTRPVHRPLVSVSAHPRSRGVDTSTLQRSSTSAGSSPLTRGRLVEGGLHLLDGGLIPAHAGSTTRLGRGPVSPQAHPRSRGVDLASLAPRYYGAGSSPLTRGRRHRHRGPDHGAGLIPAHAGSTRSTARSA